MAFRALKACRSAESLQHCYLPIIIKFLFGLIAGIALVVGTGFVYVTRGGQQMSVEGGPLPMGALRRAYALAASIGSAEDEIERVAE